MVLTSNERFLVFWFNKKLLSELKKCTANDKVLPFWDSITFYRIGFRVFDNYSHFSYYYSMSQCHTRNQSYERNLV